MKLLKFVPVLAVALLAACAPSIPQKAVDAANAAFADAKAAQADVFAPESFKAARDADAVLQANLDAKDYGKTVPLAQAVVEASAKAKTDAVAGVETAKAEVAKLSTDVPVLADQVKKELAKAVKAGKKAKVDVAKAQAEVAAATQVLTDAQAAVKAANIADAKTKLSGAQAAFTAVQQTLEAAGFKG